MMGCFRDREVGIHSLGPQEPVFKCGERIRVGFKVK